ncbi:MULTISPECIES: hypothetical protein [unclassified Moorena]|uniref:hypothetical protein n=1 Tax=unclassified Moorena TaxID=2683338 RepID=UPI00257AA353|nr:MULTISPECIES: hypothetical protein [unclassified Moorena]
MLLWSRYAIAFGKSSIQQWLLPITHYPLPITHYPLPITLQKKKRLQPLLQPPLYINWEEILEAYVKNCPRCLTSSSKATLLT